MSTDNFMGPNTNNNKSINLPKVLRIVTAIALIFFFAYIAAWFPLGYINYGLLIFYYFTAAFFVGLFIQKWWVPVLIAVPNIATAVMDFELVYVVAYIMIPVSMTLLGGAFSLYVIKKTRY